MYCSNSAFPGISIDEDMANFLKTTARAVVKLDSSLAPKDIAALADEQDAVRMLRRAGSHYSSGYGGTLNVPTIDIISTEINFIGNLVGTYNDLAELIALMAQGKVTLCTPQYILSTLLMTQSTISTAASYAVAAFSFPDA
jgi:D-arabinose 1-dehydrogenase-like Zn-dependent alcohol dehydrogenase